MLAIVLSGSDGKLINRLSAIGKQMAESLAEILESVIAEKVTGKDIAVAFSGGLDSGLIAAIAGKYAESIKLYTVGTENSYDVLASEKMASDLGMDWVHIPLNEDVVSSKLKEMISLTGTTDPIVLSFEFPLICISPVVECDLILGGQGADEIFCGYSKYLDLSIEDLQKQRNEDIAKLNSLTLPHERKVVSSFGKEIFYPFLDERVVNYVSSQNPEVLIPHGDDRKMILRDAALELGYDDIASKKKKAAQYGTGSMNIMKKISKNKGMSVSEYIIHLANGHPWTTY